MPDRTLSPDDKPVHPGGATPNELTGVTPAADGETTPRPQPSAANDDASFRRAAEAERQEDA